MKNKLLIGTILPSITAFGLIGSGFSLWIFNESNEAKLTNQNVNVLFTQTVKSGNITLDGKTELILDQKQDNLDTGCYFIKNEETLIAKYSYNFLTSTTEESGYIDGVSDIKFITTITLSKELAKYVTFTHNNGKSSVYEDTSLNTFTHNEDNTVYTFTSLASNHKAFKENENLSISNISTTVFDWDNMYVNYTDNYPTTLEAYNIMVSELINNSTINVTYSAEAFIK